MRRVLVTGKARDLLGWEANVGLREGVAETAEWLSATEVVV
jgi:nucleoside-diphosphate-sugar epimerase